MTSIIFNIEIIRPSCQCRTTLKFQIPKTLAHQKKTSVDIFIENKLLGKKLKARFSVVISLRMKYSEYLKSLQFAKYKGKR